MNAFIMFVVLDQYNSLKLYIYINLGFPTINSYQTNVIMQFP